MAASDAEPITRILHAIENGDDEARARLWTIIYEELRGIARRERAHEAPDHILQSTAIVHEAYFRLFGNQNGRFQNTQHFFGAAVRAMRQILVDDARKRGRLKRGGGAKQERLHEHPSAWDRDPTETLALDEALKGLETEAPRKAEVVMLRYYAGLSFDEIGEALGISRRMAQIDWQVARAWLKRALSEGETDVSFLANNDDDTLGTD